MPGNKKSDPVKAEPHHIRTVWPRSHMEYIASEKTPIIVCACGWKYERLPEREVGEFTGVDVVNELLDKYNSHLKAVKNHWGNFDD